MKCSDWQIGDYALAKPSMMPFKVAAVHHKKVGYHAVTHKLNWVRMDLLEPIPLTDKILEKNGFLLAKDEPETDFEPSYKEWRFTDGLITISFEPEVLAFEVHNGGEGSKPVRTMNYFTDYDVVFVHEFQHALRLCGLNDLADNFKVDE